MSNHPMPSADSTPPLTAERLRQLRDIFESHKDLHPAHSTERTVAELALEVFHAHAALTAQLAQRTAELEEARRHTEWADNLVNSAHVDWLGEVARERQRRMQAEADCAQHTAEREALKRAVVEMAIPYEALRMDDDSRKWIAPSVWRMIVEATEQARATLAAPTEG